MEYYYVQALAQFSDTTNSYYRDIRSSMALFNYEHKQQGLAARQTLKQMADEASDEDERLPRYFTIGSLFFMEGMYDSALVYLQPVFDNKSDRETRLQAADFLSKIHDSLGEYAKAESYICFLAQNKAMDADNKVKTSRLNTLFQDYINRKQTQQAAQEKREAVSRTIKWIIPIAVLIAVGLIIALRHRHKRRLEVERQAHQAKQSALSGRLKRSNQELKTLKEQVSQQETIATPQPQAASFADEAICLLIMERVDEGHFKAQMDCAIYQEFALGKEHLLALREAADCHFNRFTSRLAQTYPALTQGDLDYCCLYLLGLSDADVSALMQKAYPTVSQRSRKIRAIFGSESTLPTTLRSFANDNL